MEFFKKYFRENWKEYDTGELEVLCPFPHKDEKGNPYYESVPSAHINQHKNLFHCKVCGQGLSETAFLAKIQGISYRDAIVLIKELESKENVKWEEQRKAFLESEPTRVKWYELGLSDKTHEDLQVGYTGDGFDFPVFIYGELLDIRNYKPGRTPKVVSQRGAKNLLLPFDLWVNDPNPTVLCAGEKDMAIARQNGFNAITFTGGENAFPKLFKASFKGKKIYVCYDNDAAGHEGARKVASMLKDCGAIPYVVTGHHLVCTEKGGDIHDFFTKYKKDKYDFYFVLQDTPEFTETEYRKEQAKYIPLVSIEEASKGKYIDRLVSSRVSVTATYEEMYVVPEFAELEKIDVDEHATMAKGEIKNFILDEKNAGDILMLMDSNLKHDQIRQHLKQLSRMPPNEKFITVRTLSKMNVFKAVVTDDNESEIVHSDEESHSIREMLVYSIGEPLKPGMKYRIFFKPTAHPLKGQQIVGIVTKLEESDTSIHKFQVNEKVIDSLKVFQVQEGQSVVEKMDELYERSKGIIGPFARKEVTWATDLFYHTPLEFYFNNRLERGYIDAMIIGPERSGKSEAAKHLMRTYELGLISSLKTTTVAGLMGGSDQTSGGWKTKLGILPRNHKGALIMEEFSGGGQDLVSKLTEVRSSNRVRLTRVNGSIDVPAMVRMLSISNPATRTNGETLPIRNYPHGIQVLLELVGAAADIARYDFFLILDEPEVDEYVSPLEEIEQEPFDRTAYQNRVRWIWSRKPEDITIDRSVLEHIVDSAKELNKTYGSNIKIFGPEAWKKLSRVSIATAALLCSISEDGQKLIITKEHVDWAKNFLVSIYDNKLFKLKEYVDNQKRQVEADEASIHALQGLYNSHAIMLKQLEMSTDMQRNDLLSMSGLDSKEFSRVVNQLVRYDFVTFGTKICPTQRFRTAMTQIDRQVFLPRLGES